MGVLGGLVVDGFMYGTKAEDGFVSGAGTGTGAGTGAGVGTRPMAVWTGARAGARAGAGTRAVSEMGSLECRLQGSPRLPAFSQDGDFILGGVFSIHYYMYSKDESYTVQPQSLECTGRSVT